MQDKRRFSTQQGAEQCCSLPKVAVDTRMLVQGKSGQKQGKAIYCWFLNTKMLDEFGQSHNQLEAGTARAETACPVLHLPLCSRYGGCLPLFRLER